MRETIVAVATAAGRGGIGVLRLSGPRAADIALRLTARPLPAPRQAALRHFLDADGQRIDQGLLLHFPAPHSFTGEDVVELQGHGGPVVLDLLLRAACACGARIARPGEFSERAFLNDRIDLAQAEAIADLIDAGSRDAARAAQRSLDGALSQAVNDLTAQLTQTRVYVEGALDFSDEDIDWLGAEALAVQLAALQAELAELLSQARQGRRLRDGLTLALTGRPNVGKSTLLNRLAGAEVAIVTDIAGTTRDVLREPLDLDGLPVTVVDTAGLRDSADPVEREGVRRARAVLQDAEVVLFMTDAPEDLDSEDSALLASLPAAQTVLVLHNKCDRDGLAARRETRGGRTHLWLSAASGEGMPLLIDTVKTVAGVAGSSASRFSARSRHVDALQRAAAHIDQARQRLAEQAHAELAAEDLRLAQDALGEITGRVSSDDLLGRIFAGFCIGK